MELVLCFFMPQGSKMCALLSDSTLTWYHSNGLQSVTWRSPCCGGVLFCIPWLESAERRLCSNLRDGPFPRIDGMDQM